MVTIYTNVSGFRCLRNTIHFNTKNEQPKIYVVCLSASRNNKAYGIWVNAAQSVKEINQQIDVMLCHSPYPNPRATRSYAIRCYEGFYNLNFDLNARIEDIHAQAVFIAKHGELGAKLITFCFGHLEDAKKIMDEHYLGEYKSQAEYAIEFFDKLYLEAIPEHTPPFIDYEAFKTTIFHHYFFSITVEDKTHVFFTDLGDPEFKQCLEYFLKSYNWMPTPIV